MGFKLNKDSMKKTFEIFVRSFIKTANSKIKSSQGVLQTRIRQALLEQFLISQEYNALTGGELEYHFGFPKGSSKEMVDSIINEIANYAVVNFTPFQKRGRKIVGGVKVTSIGEGLNSVLTNSAAKIQTEKGETIPWLDWLLFHGDEIIISDHQISVGEHPRSRSGLAIMVTGGVWRVPPQYSGTENDNWVTRVIEDANEKILSIMDEEVYKVIK